MACTDFFWSHFNKHSSSSFPSSKHLLYQQGLLEETHVIETMGRETCVNAHALLSLNCSGGRKMNIISLRELTVIFMLTFCFRRLPLGFVFFWGVGFRLLPFECHLCLSFKTIIRCTSKPNLTCMFIR